MLQLRSVEFCKSTVNEFYKDSKHYLQDLCEWKKNYDASNIRNSDPLNLVAADVCSLYPSIKRDKVKMALELALKEHSKFNLSGQRILVNLAMLCLNSIVTIQTNFVYKTRHHYWGQ